MLVIEDGNLVVNPNNLQETEGDAEKTKLNL